MNLELCLRMYYNGPAWIFTSSSTLKVHRTTWALVSWAFHLIVIWKSQAWFFIVIVLNLLSNLCILMISLSFDLQINRSSSVAHCLEEGLHINSSVCTLLCLHRNSSVYVMFCVYMELELLNPMTMDWRWKWKKKIQGIFVLFMLGHIAHYNNIPTWALSSDLHRPNL